MQNSSSIESTLLYESQPGFAFSELGDWITATFARMQIRVRPKYATECDLAVTIGGLTLTIALSDQALNLGKFLQSKSPGNEFGLSYAIQRRIVAHRRAVVIRVTGPAEIAQKDTRLAICYIATMQVLGLAEPDLIHWTKSDKIYTFAQFFEQTEDIAPMSRHAPQTQKLGREPHHAAMFDWASIAEQKEHIQAMDRLRQDLLRREVFPASNLAKSRRTSAADTQSLWSYVSNFTFLSMLGISLFLSQINIGPIPA